MRASAIPSTCKTQSRDWQRPFTRNPFKPIEWRQPWRPSMRTITTNLSAAKAVTSMEMKKKVQGIERCCLTPQG
ncbi:hypothetical protein FGO68_gene15472 [Halteria grandinella]|uniref:Uncharacterized protein n=1 Tax=Halteria grandinella TaxID=5974 RepID=A0A8J8SWN5_HALGN|nr:hypothetical protein FGO68_gene15472 [Halteria grandinella]